MRRRLLFPALVLIASLAGLAAPAARAGTHDAATVALGWQTEHADLVAVVTAAAADGDVADVRVERVLCGDAAVGASLAVRFESHGRGSPWRPGASHLVFLRRLAGDAPAGFAPLCGEFSVRAVAGGGAEERFPALVADLAGVLAARDPAALRALLVTWMEDADPGVAWSAATDFVRRTDLHAGIAAAEAARVAAAFRVAPASKASKGALALAVAAARPADAAATLADALAAPGEGSLRGTVAEALRRLADPNVSALLAGRLASAASADARCALLVALADAGGADAVPVVRETLSADDARVRTEAACALGGIARSVRAADPEARIGAAGALAARLAAADTGEREARAVLWALAQLDEPRAVDALRDAALNASDASRREWAARLAARPRQSLVLPR